MIEVTTTKLQSPPVFMETTEAGASFSPCRRYRYSLWRRWEDDCGLAEMACFIGLNPSTADEQQDDPTIRRCIGFAKRWGCGGLVMLNLFAFRATNPLDMKRAADPVGPMNNDAITRVADLCSPIICCWGNQGGHLNRSNVVRHMIRSTTPKHLGLTNACQPRHPLYVSADTQPSNWE